MGSSIVRIHTKACKWDDVAACAVCGCDSVGAVVWVR